MKEKTIMRLQGLLGILVGFIVCFSLYFMTNSPHTIEEVKCYDRAWNEIKGEVCFEEVYSPIIEPFVTFGVLFAMAGGLLIPAGIVLIVVSFIVEDK